MSQTRNTRAVLITGAGKRIGRAIAAYLGEKGYSVAVHYNRSSDDAESVADDIRASGGTAIALGADLSDPVAVGGLLPAAADALGLPIRFLVNNASLFEDDRIETLTSDGWHAHMSVNTLAPLLLIQALQKGLPASDKGAVVNIIDQRVWRLNPTFMTYTASKAALWALTQTTAQALAPWIRVNAIGPGPVLQSIHQSAETFSGEAVNVPLQRGPSLDEIATTVDFLFSASSMTGQMIALDGGQHLAWQTPDIVHD